MNTLELVLIVIGSSVLSALVTVGIVWHMGKKIMGSIVGSLRDMVKAMTGLGG